MTLSHFVGGERIEGGPVHHDLSPSDSTDVVASWGAASEDLAHQAIEAAVAAAPGWASTTGARRGEILTIAGLEIERRADELGRVLAREEGKTLPEAIGEVRRAAQILQFQGGQAIRNRGQLLDSVRPGIEVSITREPVGVVSVIAPWNFPIAIPAWKIAPALAYGNTVVLKPAEAVPASAWHLVDILHRAGLPDGVLNLVLGRGREIGDVLTGSVGLNAVTFTGSEDTGRRVLERTSAAGIRAQLEMGGKNPLVVLDDADIEVAVTQALAGAYGSTGQRCTASSRLIVTRGIHDRFVDGLSVAMAGLRVGHALEDGIDMGPVVDRDQLDQDRRYVSEAADAGREVVGGQLEAAPTDGFFMRPALVLGTDPEDAINREEVFGPVASVIEVEDYEQALAVANDTPYGLTAGIITTSLAAAHDFRRRAEAGMVMVNLATAGVDFHVPFGGRGASSFGPREQGEEAREFFTQVKTAYVASGAVT
ncbi:aldehyde dehydrogenase [Nocardioides sp. Root1257]|uniref:aldehyde dehydrogenase family protein n=1 Tax=unclassified Nocardioides TaxID=2615069 RepID=UPI0006F5D3F1|nr:MULTISPECIES: aldehyde dehydrogenase family protein [unclassified Nocardioides]KQW46091.1 aldehyde dehydrogenase [Nocardioides sp. Root1257]KRC43391.1 aldehyde dehydrogenase [Nocardioides sp. Root224]